MYSKSIKIDNDIDGILNNIGSHLTNRIDPLKKAFEEFNKEKFNSMMNKGKQDDTFKNLKKSNQVSAHLLKNSVQIWNLLKVMSKKHYLSNLKAIDEVYDSQADFVEEIEYYHKNRDSFEEMKRKNQYLTSSVGFNDYNQDNQLVINSSDEEEKGLSKENRINSIIIPD